MVPTVLCRICGEKFYATAHERHAKFCEIKKDSLQKKRRESKPFLNLSQKLTDTIIKMKSQASEFSSEKGSSYRRMSIVSSSSFYFLNKVGTEVSDRRKSVVASTFKS